MATKTSIFSSVISGSPMITSEKLVGSENYLSWSASVELWFMGQGYEDHLVTQEADIPEAKGLYTNDIQRLYKVASAIVHISQQDLDLSTYIGQIASLKEEFLTVMPLTPDVGAQQTQLKFFMVLTLIGLRPDLEPRDQFLPPSSSASQASQASIASVAQPGSFLLYYYYLALPTVTLANGSQTVAKGIGLALPLPSLPLTSVLYTPECPFNLISISKITRTLNCSITFSDKFVTLQDRSTGKTIGIGRESQGLYHLTSDSSPAVCISTDAPLLIHNRWATLVSPSSRRWSSFFHFVVASVPFTSFMSHHGILHQSSCAHTPQQNGVAERKNRHLVETARTILLHNSSLLLFPDQPLYFLPPRVFGCTCFVHILTPGQDKLSAKAMKCLFLGYSRLQKGYRCYSLETHRYFISADVYHRRPRVAAPLPFAEAPADSLPIPSASPAPALPSPDDYPLLFGKSTHEALSHPGWRQAMVDEMAALHSNGTWDLVVLPSGKSTVGCRWVYAVKVGPDGQVDRLKARLVAKGYTQVYGSDYGDTFSLLPRLLLSACFSPWLLCVLGLFIRESGLVCRLRRSLYGLKQSPRAWFGRFSSVVQEFGMLRSTADHSVFYHHNSLGQCIYLVVYVDDIVITGVIRMLNPVRCGPFPKEVCFRHPGRNGGAFRRPWEISTLVGKLNYLTITRPDISFPVSVVSQFLQSPCDSHWDAVIRILRYIKSTPGQGVLYENRGHTQVVGYTDADWAGSPTDRRSTSGYCVFIGGNLISWKSKKQDVVARSSAEAEYRAMALATCELIWLRHLLRELRFGKDEQMKLICDNQAALHIASNPVFHERTNILKLTVTSLERRSHQDVLLQVF
ncbi:Retrovirus-related Pol polyprotein from transposon RE1 [Vitis vinifera]|uniref:Retrovirus-related Pol polyprotein from transposon RE1 n=1 Tax=Vitis vinifera TaxID=29760 RepID=A0A438H4F5_VITVI|nr:Retrovirus-related Pol polyprotein from transposon RE1 [Vitis vinifera]